MLFGLAGIRGAGCDSLRVFCGECLQCFVFATLQKLQGGFGLFFALLQFRLFTPILLIGSVQFLAIGSKSDEPFHEPLLVKHVAALHDLRGRKNAGQRVVVGGGNGIELMIVAASATKCLPENGAADRVNLFVGNVHPSLLRIIAEQHLGADDQKTGCNSLPVALLDGVEREQVAGELLGQEPIEGKVRIDCSDHPVAITPRFAEQKVLVQTIGIRVTRQIEPMPPPPLAKLRRAQKLVDQARCGCASGRWIVQKAATCSGVGGKPMS